MPIARTSLRQSNCFRVICAIMLGLIVSRSHPSSDVILFGERAFEEKQKMSEIITSHDVRCVIALAFCSQKSFREITPNYAKLP